MHFFASVWIFSTVAFGSDRPEPALIYYLISSTIIITTTTIVINNTATAIEITVSKMTFSQNRG